MLPGQSSPDGMNFMSQTSRDRGDNHDSGKLSGLLGGMEAQPMGGADGETTWATMDAGRRGIVDGSQV